MSAAHALLISETTKLDAMIAQMESLKRTAHAAFKHHAHTQEVVEAVQHTYDVAMQVLCQAADTPPQSEDDIRIDVGQYASNVVDLLLSGTESQVRLDERSITELSRKLASVLHPDKPTGDARLFQMTRQAKASRNLPVLYSMWVKYARAGETPDYDTLVQSVTDRAEGELTRMRAVLLPITVPFMSGAHDRTVNAMVSALRIVALRNTRILYT